MSLGRAHRLGRYAAVAVGLVAVLSACTGAAVPARVPAKAAASSTPALETPLLTPRQQVIAAYTGYTAAMTAAFGSRSAARVKQLLQPFLDAAAIRAAVRAFSQAWARNEISYGQVVQHIIGVRIEGTAAWVHDCDNTSGSGLQYAGTGRIVPGSLGIPDDNIVTRLNLVHGHWIVWLQTVEDVPCTA